MGQKSSLMLQDDEIRQIGAETGFSPQQIEKLYSRFTQLDRTNCGSLGKTDLLSIPELAINPLCERLIEMFFSDGADGDEERINFRQFTRVLAAFRSNQQQQQQQQQQQPQHQLESNITVATLNHKPHYMEHSAESDEAKSSSDDNLPGDPRRTTTTSTTAAAATRRPQKRLRHLRPLGAGKSLSRGSSQSKPVGCMSQENLNNCLSRRLYFVFKIYDNDNDGRISFTDLRSILKLMVGNYIEDVQLDKIATRAFVEVDQDNDGFIEFGEFCKVFAGKDMEDKLRVKFF